jgi:hypothetical protein
MVPPLFAALDPMLTFWPYFATLLNVLFCLLAAGHAVLTKRDTRATIGWVGVIWLAPVLGVLLYVWLGINRIERRARSLRAERPRLGPSAGLGGHRWWTATRLIPPCCRRSTKPFGPSL